MAGVLKRAAARLVRGEAAKIDALHGRHAGEACYIFGNGVSLKWMDLRAFADRPAIVGTMAMYHNEVRAMRPAYATLIEPYWFWPVFPYRGGGTLKLLSHDLHHEYRKTIREHRDTLFFLNASNYPVTRFANAVYTSRWYTPPFAERNPFRERGDAHQGTLKFQLSLAIFLGFSKAYLVGHDYTHVPSRDLHFYEKGEGRLGAHPNFCRDFIDYARGHMELVTVTLDGTSDTMPSVTYSQLMGREPRFRENVDLVDRAKLESLAKWHGYSIF